MNDRLDIAELMKQVDGALTSEMVFSTAEMREILTRLKEAEQERDALARMASEASALLQDWRRGASHQQTLSDATESFFTEQREQLDALNREQKA